MASQKVIAVDLGTDTIKSVALELVRGEIVPRVLGTGYAASAGVRKGSIVDSEDLAAALKESLDNLQKSTGIKAEKIFVGMGGQGLGFQKSKGLVAISRADNEVSKEDVKRALLASEANLQRIQNRDILHKIPISYTIDNEVVTHDPVGLAGIKLESSTMFLTLFMQQLKSVMKALDDAGTEPEDVFAGPMALSHAVLTKREKEAGVMILDIGASTTSLIIFEEGLPYSLEVLPIGGVNITHDIAVGFQASIEDAEKLKLGFGAVSSAALPAISKKKDLIFGNYSKKDLTQIIEARLGDIFELVEKHLKKMDRMGLLPAGVVIAGGGSKLPGIMDFAKDYLKLPAKPAELPNLGGYKEKVKDPEWYTALGVALMALEINESLPPIFPGFAGAIFKWFKAFLP
ncbi:cell division protein FtsA [Candidatus Giovannonibacteria bacterium]|nr:cell division protein FtsA [Candidatus Giovannonibacteria bacterium]